MIGHQEPFGGFNTQPPEGGWAAPYRRYRCRVVSTHSRPKAAGSFESALSVLVWLFQHTAARRRLVPWRRLHQPHRGFNTQPPEGGWQVFINFMMFSFTFQHTAARRRLDNFVKTDNIHILFQHTAARRRLVVQQSKPNLTQQFQHTAARRRLGVCFLPHPLPRGVSTHSRPKAAGASMSSPIITIVVSTHSRPKAAGSAA